MVTSPGVLRAVCAEARMVGLRSDHSRPPATALAASVKNVLRFSSLAPSCSISDSNMIVNSSRPSSVFSPQRYSLHRHEVRRFAVHLRKVLFQVLHLRGIVEADIHAVGMHRRIVL